MKARQRITNTVYLALFLSSLFFTGFSYSAPVSLPGDVAPRGAPDGVIDSQDIEVIENYISGSIQLTDEEKRVADVAPYNAPNGIVDDADKFIINLHILGTIDLDNQPPSPISLKNTTIDFSPINSEQTFGWADINGDVGSVESGATVSVYNPTFNQTKVTQADNEGRFTATLPVVVHSTLSITVKDDSNNSSLTRSAMVLQDPIISGRFSTNEINIQYPGGLPDPADPENPKLLWATMTYPVDISDPSMPVDPVAGTLPIVIFVHGNNVTCDLDGDGPGLISGEVCDLEFRVPHHRGYLYIMEKLASQGYFAISVYNHGQGQNVPLRYLDVLTEWNTTGSSTATEIGTLFQGKLDFNNIGLVGHSQGGDAIVIAFNNNSEWSTVYNIKALTTIAPPVGNPLNQTLNIEEYKNIETPYMTVTGSRDGDVDNGSVHKGYALAGENSNTNNFKSLVYVHGANHKYYNTIWTDSAALGEQNPWAGSGDDGNAYDVEYIMSAQDQRESALASIVPFLRWQLKGDSEYKRIVTGGHRFSSNINLANKRFFLYRAADSVLVENFTDSVPFVNNLGGNNIGTFPITVECSFFDDCGGIQFMNFNASLQQVSGIGHYLPERWLGVTGGTQNTFTFTLPTGQQNLTNYVYLSFDSAKYTTGFPPINGPDLALLVNIVDTNGNTALWDLRTTQYATLPHSYVRAINSNCGAGATFLSGCYFNTPNTSYFSTVEIPLQDFKETSPDLDLTSIEKIVIRAKNNDNFGIDNVQISR